MRIWLFEIDALDSGLTPVTLRYSTHYYKSESEPYEVRLEQPGLFNVRASSIFGQSRSAVGQAILSNADGGLDFLADYYVDGRTCRLTLVSTDGEEFPESEAYAVLEPESTHTYDVDGADTELLVDVNSFQAYIGIVERFIWSGDKVQVQLKDGREALDRTHPYTTYAGDNVLPDGVEGVETDIQGTIKPVVYGAVVNAKPILVNTSQLIYQVHEGSPFTVGAVYDQGVLLTEAAGQPETSLSNLYASSPIGGEYTWFDGYIKVGAQPQELTVSGGNGTGGNDAGATFSQVAGEAGFSVDPADVTALNALGKARFYLTSETTTATILDDIAKSFGCYWALLPNGTIRVKQLAAPDASPSIVIEDYQILSISRAATGSGPNGIPSYRVIIEQDPTEYVQSTFAAAAHPAVVARFSKKYRNSIAEDTSVKTNHLLSEELKVTSLVRNKTEADAVASTLLGLVKVRRDTVSVTARLKGSVLQSMSIGSSVKVISSKLGYSAGRNFLVMGYEINGRTDTVKLELWG